MITDLIICHCVIVGIGGHIYDVWRVPAAPLEIIKILTTKVDKIVLIYMGFNISPWKS